MAGAMQDVESEVADFDLIALVEPAVGSEIAHIGHAKTFAATHDIIEQIFVSDMRAFDLHLQGVAQLGGAADMIDMAVGEPDFLNRDAGLLDRLQNLRNVPAGV